MVSQEAIGYIGSAIAIVFFGSNYVVTKKFPTGDGFMFSWILSCGILLVGFACIGISHNTNFYPTGLIGGCIWALGNLMVPKIVQWIGLGLGFLLWSGSNLIMGYFVGKFGLFGVAKEVTVGTAHEVMNITGIIFAFIGLLPYFFIKPDLSDDKSKTYKQQQQQQQPEADSLARTEEGAAAGYQKGTGDITKRESEPLLINTDSTAPDPEKKTVWWQRVLGMIMALVAGCFYGVNLVPFGAWDDKPENKDKDPLGFTFSYFCGIWLTTTVAFLIYAAIKKNRPQLFPQTIIPSVISGVMWGIASCGLFYSTKYLGFTIGYPISGIGPTMVTAFWSVVVFREIRGLKNLLLLGGSLIFVISGVILLALSH